MDVHFRAYTTPIEYLENIPVVILAKQILNALLLFYYLYCLHYKLNKALKICVKI